MRKAHSRRQFLMSGAGAAGLVAVESASAQDRAAATPSKMRLGLVTYNVAKDWDLDTILKTCKSAGIEGVEFRTTHAHGVEPVLDSGQRKSLKQKLADSGLKQISLGSTCEFQSQDAAVVKQNLETCRQFVELAKDLGARAVKVRPNGLPGGVPVEQTLEQIGKALKTCGEIGASSGVEIWMEVHGNGTSLPANSRKIMDACGHPNVGVTWNSNATDVAGGSVREAFQLLRPYIRCCHINDLWGDYPYRELFALLNQTDYDRFTLIECGFPMSPEDGTQFLKCYRALWKEMSR